MPDRKLSWFDQGAAALRACFDSRGRSADLPAGACYYCPCCLALHDRDSVVDGLLTAEDVPPKSVGGRKILLTCEDCNGSAGRDLDHHASKRQMVEDFLRGTENGHVQRFTMTSPNVSI